MITHTTFKIIVMAFHLFFTEYFETFRDINLNLETDFSVDKSVILGLYIGCIKTYAVKGHKWRAAITVIYVHTIGASS